MTPFSTYPAISDYALIGNRHTCALVARDGAIEWCCLPHLDSPSLFAAMLDRSRGGTWRIGPVGKSSSTRRYMGHSPILETEFRGAAGVLRLRDFLPIREGDEEQKSESAHALVRTVECLEGEVEVEMLWQPRPNYARDDVRLAWEDGHILAHSTTGVFWLVGMPADMQRDIEEAGLHARFRLGEGERLDFICGHGMPLPLEPAPLARRYLDETVDWWRDWVESCHIEDVVEPWRDMVIRSGMVLKLLTNERTGAIAAAPTTSLPEEIGGVRNWDYRYCWVRDSSMIAQAFVSIGQEEAAISFLDFLERTAQKHRDPARVQVVYGLNGETTLSEFTLGHLDGYRDSRPVRVGNGAATQRQLDVYGELLEAALDLLKIGAEIDEEQWGWLRSVANHVCNIWELKDRSIWEVRGPDQHFTYSKLMCWVALDRALKIADRLGSEDGELERWEREREAIRESILENAFSNKRNSFTQAYESEALDASNLIIPMVDFLPADDPRVQGTIDATLEHLTRNNLVYRYLVDETEDGVSGDEGAFGICTFWLVIALSLSGRLDEARQIFETLLGHANDLGLYPEEFDTETGKFLGNFPQAFTHVGLINAAHFYGRALGGNGARKLMEGDHLSGSQASE